jgi:outer membrane protein insertion porin family
LRQGTQPRRGPELGGRLRFSIGGPAYRLGLWLVILLLCCTGRVSAQQQGQPSSASQVPLGGTVREIRIEGTERIEPETVRSYLTVQPGDAFSTENVDKSLKSLFATGLFADVVLRRQGDALIVHVVENPIINRIAFEGNHKFDDKAISDELQLRPRTVYTRTKVQADVTRILDLYRRSGRFAATVEPKVIPLDQNRVDLVFEIDEGSVTRISSINFVGNRRFGSSRLQQAISTKESRWYRFLSTSDTYDPDRLNYDRELLRKFYLGQGYADFRVISAVAELAPDKEGFFITFTIEEGERYKFGKVDLISQLKDVGADSLKPLVTIKEGDWYNADEVDSTITHLTDELGTRGFAFVDIQPQVARNREAHTIDLVYNVLEGPRVFVERIDVVGNVRTLDKVVRREFRLVEGDAFNTAKLRRSQQRIKNLDFFKKVDVNTAQGSAPDRTVITVEVEEQSTGEITLGGGFSTTDGPLGNVSLRERNLLGRGQDLRVGFTLSARAQQIDLSFTEPYFLDRNIAAGFDLFQIDQQNRINSVYDQFSLGGALRAGYQLSEFLRHTLRYTLRQDRIKITDTANASAFIRAEAGTRVTSSVGEVLLYDKRDNIQDPSDGYFASLGTDVAGLGGDVRYVRNKVGAGWFFPAAPKWVISVTGEAGDIRGLGQHVGIQDRWFVGGDNLHGFATAGIGPRSKETGDALGGNDYYVGSVSLGFPLGLPEEFGVSGRIFTDVGSLFNFSQSNADSAFLTSNCTASKGADCAIVQGTTNKLRASAGAGVAWKSPFGPIRLDLAIPVLKETFDKKELFRVSFGTRF